jgi:dihydroorotate dehydrogenase
MMLARRLLLAVYAAAYTAARPLIFRRPPEAAHEDALRLLARADATPPLLAMLSGLRRAALPRCPVSAGGVDLPWPLIVAAGFVKGMGFDDERAALGAAKRGDNIMPGWASLSALVGPVEFGSFTRLPRLGNAGTVLWREPASRSLQNRIGLKNPGARAAADFLAARRDRLPLVFGINIAPTPGVTDFDRECADILDSLKLFIDAGVRPAWYTLNLSCPNTEDDPAGRQTADNAQALCSAAAALLRQEAVAPPLWIKIGPALGEIQYRELITAVAAAGGRAVIATNTLAQPIPEDSSTSAGVSGGRLREHALHACAILVDEQRARSLNVDVIACGGILDASSFAQFRSLGIAAAQYWSALVYHGPLAAALILQGNAR